jgi:hypothetical protein
VKGGEDREWTIESLLVFLNNLGDDWWCCRRGHVETIRGWPTFTCTFRNRAEEHREIHIVWPLKDTTRGLRNPTPPEVSISFGWIHPSAPEPEEIGADSNPSQRPAQAEDPEDETAIAVGESDLYARDDEVELARAPVDDGAPDEAPADEGEPDEDPDWSANAFWKVEKERITELRDARGRRTKKPQTRTYCTFEGQFRQRESSSWIWRNNLLLIHDSRDFSWPMRYFLQEIPIRLLTLGDPWPMEQLLESFRALQTVPAPSHSPAEFLALPGLLGLDLSEPSSRDKLLQSFKYDDHDWSILSGYWVSPFAESVLRRHDIDGLIMDTTFTVMSRYYTAILVAVYHNVGIPLAISFAPRESIELYNTFYRVFQREFDIDLATYILESDQDSALKAVGQRHPRHLFCLRHVLKSLHTKNCGRFGSIVGNLISARSEKELKLLLKVYTADFAAVFRENGEDAIKLARCLKKVGLFYRDGNLVFADPQKTRWRQFSLLERLDTHMPTTSNTIESLNGRLNAKTPRFNCFWGSLHRFRKTIVNKTERFWRSLSHNKEYERGKATRRAKNLPADRMARELAFFHTTQDACLCGETAFARTLYRTDVLCSHRLAVWSREHPNPGWDLPPIDDGPHR